MNDYDDAMCITELRKEIERLKEELSNESSLRIEETQRLRATLSLRDEAAKADAKARAEAPEPLYVLQMRQRIEDLKSINEALSASYGALAEQGVKDVVIGGGDE
jgi:hypothetical protein